MTLTLTANSVAVIKNSFFTSNMFSSSASVVYQFFEAAALLRRKRGLLVSDRFFVPFAQNLVVFSQLILV